MKTIYLDNAGTTQMSPEVKKAMLPFFDEEYGNASSLHFLGQKARERLEEARADIAKCLNCLPEEIFFTSGGSESDNWAITSACREGERKGKKHIITSAFEHHAVLNTVKRFEREGFRVTYLPVYENGIVKVEDLQNALTDDTALVTIMFANNEIGTIQPIEEIGKICKEKGVLFHCDAVQAVGHVEVDLQKLPVDMLSISAHKFHGPKGVGVLFKRKGKRIESFILGGTQEMNKRAGTENVAGCVGMAVALKEACKNLKENNEHEKRLRDKLFDELSKIPHSRINGDRINRLPNNFNMSFEGIEGEGLILLLSDSGICSSSGSACTSGSLDPSHVLLSIGLIHDVAHGSLRLTLSRFTTEEEIDFTIKEVKRIVEYLRSFSPLWKDYEKGVKKHVI